MGIQSENELERYALEIPASSRLRLAAKLLASVPASSLPALNESEAFDLAESRADELDSGKAKSLSYREEMQRIRKTLSQ